MSSVIESVSMSVSVSTATSISWFGFNTITRVVGVVSEENLVDWDISCSGLVLSSVENLLLISVGGLVVDDWNISCVKSGDSSVLSVIDSVVSCLFLSSILSLMLDSVVGVEDSVVSDFFILSVENSVLVGVSCLWLVSVESLRILSGEDVDLSSVSVFFLLSVVNLVVSLVSGEWNISVFGLSVVSIDESWLPGESLVVVWSVVDFVGGGVPDLLLWSVLGLSLGEFGGDWNLSSPDLGLDLGGDGVLDLVVYNFDIAEAGLFTVFGVGVRVLVISEFDGCCGSNEGYSEFHSVEGVKILLLITGIFSDLNNALVRKKTLY